MITALSFYEAGTNFAKTKEITAKNMQNTRYML